MKRFTDIQRKIRKINEQELTLPQNTQEENDSQEQKVETTTTTEPSSGDKAVKFFSKLFESREKRKCTELLHQ